MTAFINMYNLNCNILSLKLCELSSLPTWLKPNDLSNKNSLFIRSYPYYVQSKKPRAGGSAKVHRQATIWCHGYSLLFPIKYNKTCFSETAINRRKSDPAAQKFYLSLQFSGAGSRPAARCGKDATQSSHLSTRTLAAMFVIITCSK